MYSITYIHNVLKHSLSLLFFSVHGKFEFGESLFHPPAFLLQLASLLLGSLDVPADSIHTDSLTRFIRKSMFDPLPICLFKSSLALKSFYLNTWYFLCLNSNYIVITIVSVKISFLENIVKLCALYKNQNDNGLKIE